MKHRKTKQTQRSSANEIRNREEATDVGENLYTVATDDYKAGDNKFTGKIDKVNVQLGESNLSEEAQKAVAEMRMQKALDK